MTVEKEFRKAVDKMKNMGRVDFADRLEVYALYKQATFGDCQTKRPIRENVALRKWKAWKSLTGLSKHEAMRAYAYKIEELDDLLTNYV